MPRAWVGVLCLWLGAAAAARGQSLSPAGTGGVGALVDALARAAGEKRVLVIGAHPDDEDNALIALLSRGLGAEVAYLSLTRGEGGQNLVGTELGPALGLLRSEELLAARAVDGARQFFTRAYDFGYSRSAEETFQHWPEDALLADVLAVIRRFRPQVLVSVFSGTPRDGHGHHQVAGLLARRAYDALRDSTWGPVKLYRVAWRDTAAATLQLAAGELDPVTGHSYYQIAMASRSRHRSQDMGQLQPPGPHTVRLALVAARESTTDDAFFAGVDTGPPGSPRYRMLLDSARAVLHPQRTQQIVPLLAGALHELGRRDGARRVTLGEALATAAGVVVDPLADDDVVTPGQRVQVEVGVWNAGTAAVQVERIDLAAPPGWDVQRLDASAVTVAPGALVRRKFAVVVSRTAARTEPYFLRQPRVGDLYDWAGVPADQRGLPFQPPPLLVRAHLQIAGETVTLEREVVRRVRDQAVGEVRRPLAVTQAFDVEITPATILWPAEGRGSGPRQFDVTVTNRTRGPATARLALILPPGWSPTPVPVLEFTREDEARRVPLTLTPPAGVSPGRYVVRAVAVGENESSSGALRIVSYPYVRPRAYAQPSTAELHVARIALPALRRIGYIRGAADRVPEALSAVGFPVDVLPADSLGGDLSAFDVIVVGSRAYEVDPRLIAYNARLLDYARAGGLVIVQYQQYDFVQGGYAPERLTIARPHDRVTDELAPVTELIPDHPVFHTPNVIGPDDWADWVQERGLYFAHEWAPAYTPLLEIHDPGGEPLRGGLLVAPVGRGLYVYTGLSFFRQLPAGVPGAFRLFANILALGGVDVE